MRDAGFTLIELLVVIAIVGVLVGLLLPAVQAAREAARKVQCQSNIRQIAIAIHRHEATTGAYPSGRFMGSFGVGRNSLAWSWLAQVLPQIEQQALFDKGNVGHARLEESTICDNPVALYLCPSDPWVRSGTREDAGDLSGFAVAFTNYKACSGSNWGHDAAQGLTNIGTNWPNLGSNGSWDGLNQGDGVMYRMDYVAPRSSSHVVDGLSNSFLVGETLPELDRWTSWPYSNNSYATCAIPPNIMGGAGNFDPLWWPNVMSFRSRHEGIVSFAMADGSVHTISDCVDLKLYRQLATIQGREVVQLP